MTSPHVLSLALLAGAILPMADAQDVLRFSWGGSPRDGFGRTLASAGDLDRDGVPDLVVGATQLDRHGQGYAVVLGGRDGALLLELLGTEPDTLFGAAVCGAGDVDGDGVADVAVGAPHDTTHGVRAGAVHVWSGRDGARLFTAHGLQPHARFGSALASVADVDGDGRPDLAVGAPYDPPRGPMPGSVFVISSRDGRPLLELRGTSPADGFGTSLAFLGDVGGDAQPELAVGAPFASDGGRHAGRVDVVSLPGAQRLHTLRGFDGERFGSALASLDDLDHDHRRDLVVGVPAPRGIEAPSRVCVLSGASGRELLSFSSELADDGFGETVAGGGDVDGDGAPDVLVGAPNADVHGFRSGRASVHSGRDGAPLLVVDGDVPGSGLGRCVAILGDLDDDGRADLALGHDGTSRTPAQRGTLWFVRGERRVEAPPAEAGGR